MAGCWCTASILARATLRTAKCGPNSFRKRACTDADRSSLTTTTACGAATGCR